mgnify:CR=1 FL=1
MEYQIDDKQLNASVFLSLFNQVWLNAYDVKQIGSGEGYGKRQSRKRA